MRRVTAAIAVALSVLGATAGAGALEPGCREIRPATATAPAVEACRQDVWFHAAQTKAGNAAALPAEAGQSFPSWNTTKPAASVTTGAGAGYVTVAAADAVQENHPAARPRFVGNFDGVMDNLALTGYVYAPAPQQAKTYDVILRLEIDGTTIWNNYDAQITTPLVNGANPYEPARFNITLTNIAQTMQDNGLSLAGPHRVELSVINFFFGEDHSMFVYDAAEVPAGIVFNLDPADPAYTASTVVPTS